MVCCVNLFRRVQNMTSANNLPNDLEAFWMPFTPNRRFKAEPKLMVSAKGLYYQTSDGRQILDAIAGLWCCNAGHCHPRIIEAIQQQAATLDYATNFNTGHPLAFTLATRLANLLPGDLNHIFFTNSGSESVDTALKIALGYHRIRGEGTRTRFIGRSRGYHGVGFGGISVGGLVNNRRMFATLLPGVDHLRDTHNLEHNAFSRGQPLWGAHLADELEHIVHLHDPSTIAAVIVEPLSASGGVLVPPVGYLDRLRAICSKYGILLIFDEVITGFGRTGQAFGAITYGVQPDIMTLAKGLTSGAVPMGAVAVSASIYQSFMQGPEHLIEFFHGYTYSGHPLAAAAGIATLDVYRDEQLFERAAALAPFWEAQIHSLRGAPHVVDIRTQGLIAGIELAPAAPGAPSRALDIFERCYTAGILVRTTGDTIALTPPLTIGEAEISHIVDTLRATLNANN